jgi:hypothetical protein
VAAWPDLDAPAERTLGSEGEAFLRERLSSGKTLSHLILEEVALDDGIVVTCLSPDVTEAQACRFDQGGVIPPRPPSETRYSTDPRGEQVRIEPVPNTDDWLSGLVYAELDKEDNLACLVEHSWMKPSYPAFVRVGDRKLVKDDEVYYLVSRGAARNPARVWALGTGVVGVGRAAFQQSEAELDDKTLRDFAASARLLFLRAYDGESYIVWRRGAFN